MVSGKYDYIKEYHGHPSFKRDKDILNADHSAKLVDQYLFYHENRWVIEPVLGVVSTTSGEELYGLLRSATSFKCAENVGRNWTYWIGSGKVDKADQPIDVFCSN